MAVRIADSLKQQNNLTTFPVAYGADLWLDKNKGVGTPSYDSIQNLYNNGQLGGSSMQVSVMPNASEDYLGNIVQYVGENGTYKKGHFYECIHNITDVSDLYEWQELNHLRFNHTIYSMTTEPINSYFTVGDIIYYTGKSTQNFKANHFYRALPNATPQTIYQVDMKESALVGSVYNCYTPFELRIGFIIFPTSTGGEETPYQITDFDDNGITITPYGWSGSEITYVGASYSTTVLGWEELEGGGGDEEFIGTQAEWNALTAQEKEKYDGKIVNIVEDGESSTKEVEELTNYLFTEQALAAFPDITQRFHVYKYGRLIQISCDNLQLNRTLLNSDYFKIADGLPAPIYTINFVYPTFPDDTLGKSSTAPGYIGTGGNVVLRHIGMISDSATYLQGFTVVYLTRGV